MLYPSHKDQRDCNDDPCETVHLSCLIWIYAVCSYFYALFRVHLLYTGGILDSVTGTTRLPTEGSIRSWASIIVKRITTHILLVISLSHLF